MGDTILEFPKLIDSSIEAGVITYNSELKNPKERIATCSLELNGVDGDKSKVNFLIEYTNLYNLSYQMKSMINQINESIQNFNKS